MKRLPRGPHALPPDAVARNQRERLFAAIAESLYEQGYERTTVTAIGARAHVSKGDFYRLFESKDACFLAAYDAAVAQLREEALAACAGRFAWEQRVCAALGALLASMASRPAAASLVLVDGLRCGREAYARFERAVRGFAPLLREGAPPPVGDERLPAATDEAVVGGIASLLGRRVAAGDTERLPEFFPEVAEFALTPYLGAAGARRIVSAR